MPEESAGDKTEEATPRRRQRERERGRVAKSRDLGAAAILLGGVLLLKYGGHSITRWILAGTRRFIGEDMRGSLPPSGEEELMAMVYVWMTVTGHALLPFLLALFVIALLASYGQVGFLFSADPLTPDLNRINPISGFKKVFGLRGVMTLLMNLMKLTAVVVLVYLTLRNEIPAAMGLTLLTPGQIFLVSTNAALGLALKLAIMFLIIGFADFAYQTYQQGKDMKMTKQEVKEELKETEGDPHIRAKRRQIQRQMAMQRMMQEIPQAEVVVRNPTSFAVALKFSPEMEVPVVIAKGADRMAKRIIESAKANGVPVWTNRPLARQLFRLDLGEAVPSALFPAVAEVLAHVLRGDKLERYRQAMSGAAA